MNLSFIGDLTVDIYPKLNKILLGGSSLTSALWAKKLGAECTILASVGNDEAGKRYFQFFKKNGLSTKFLNAFTPRSPAKRDEVGPTSRIEIFIDKNGEHTFGEWEPGAYADYHLSKKDFTILKTQDAVVVPVYFKTRHLLEELIKINNTNDHAERGQIPLSGMTNTPAGGPISNEQLTMSNEQHPLIVIDFDDLSQFGKSQKIIEDHLPYIDIVKLGLDIDIDRELLAEIKYLAQEYPEKIFLITLNKEGSVVFCGYQEFWEKADNIKVKNTTGAGDAYIAGFLVEYLTSGDLKKSMKNGTATATLAIS